MASAQAAHKAMRVGYRTIDGVRIRYAESDGPITRAIVLTSPWPESVCAFHRSMDSAAILTTALATVAGPLANAEFLTARIPRSRLATIDCGHFVREEAPDEFAGLIAAWVDGGYRQLSTHGN